ncbi:hypothetical protein [Streptomyces sp. TP-A0874]|uniref:hypothetical protein n=1 Tax=Streptomyces sp. TP-A0874 TaxID=549819 RepID=UPI000852D7F2|nr:hypothetical protein [Streptomyces sp. TP-A0874]
MADPEFEATGVGIERRLRSLTRAGRVRIGDGRLTLLTSYGSEIDSAPVDRVEAGRPWFARDRALATLNGTRYLLTLRDRDPAPGESGPPSRGRFLDAVRAARGRSRRD